MTFAHKLIHGGPVHPCYEPLEALQQYMVLSESVMCESESGFGFESGFRAFWAKFGFMWIGSAVSTQIHCVLGH